MVILNISLTRQYRTDYDSAFTSFIPLGELLNKYITSGHYLGDIAFEQIGPDETQEALQAAQKICDAVVGRIDSGQLTLVGDTK